MYKLFLDDERNPYDCSWDVARNYDAFVRHIEENGTPHIISFDHDLSFEHYPFAEQDPGLNIPYDKYKEKTGYHAAMWLVETGRLANVRTVYIHTQNIVGRVNLLRLFRHERMEDVRVIAWTRNGPQEIKNPSYLRSPFDRVTS